MSTMAPLARPGRPREWFLGLLRGAGVEAMPALVGCRGYYLNSMGAPGRNDRGIYDDAIAVVSGEAFATFNANVDPSVARPGIAVLDPGVWWYKLGIHGLSRPKAQQYEALVQAGPVTVTRDGKGQDSGWFGINIHRGSRTTTSSLGCQTIHPDQWDAFLALVRSELKRVGAKRLPYLLLEQQG